MCECFRKVIFIFVGENFIRLMKLFFFFKKKLKIDYEEEIFF